MDEIQAKRTIRSSGTMTGREYKPEDSERIGPMGYVLQSPQIADHAGYGMKWDKYQECVKADKEAGKVKPHSEHIWCKECGAVQLPKVSVLHSLNKQAVTAHSYALAAKRAARDKRVNVDKWSKVLNVLLSDIASASGADREVLVKKAERAGKYLEAANGRFEKAQAISDESDSLDIMARKVLNAAMSDKGFKRPKSDKARKRDNRVFVWTTAHLAGKSDLDCSHQNVQGVRLEAIMPSSTTPGLMSSGKWNARMRTDQVQSPVSHSHLRKGIMSASDLSARVGRFVGIEAIEAASPARPIASRNDQGVLIESDGFVSGDSCAPLPLGDLTDEVTLLHDGREIPNRVETSKKSHNTRKANSAKIVAKVMGVANAEIAASKKGKRGESDILADLRQLADKVHNR